MSTRAFCVRECDEHQEFEGESLAPALQWCNDHMKSTGHAAMLIKGDAMFDVGKETYKSDLKLGERYKDKTTNIEGHLVGIHFYEHACERATLRYVDANKNVIEVTFDAPELVSLKTQRAARTTRSGGPARATGARTTPSR